MALRRKPIVMAAVRISQQSPFFGQVAAEPYLRLWTKVIAQGMHEAAKAVDPYRAGSGFLDRALPHIAELIGVNGQWAQEVAVKAIERQRETRREKEAA